MPGEPIDVLSQGYYNPDFDLSPDDFIFCPKIGNVEEVHVPKPHSPWRDPLREFTLNDVSEEALKRWNSQLPAFARRKENVRQDWPLIRYVCKTGQDSPDATD